MVRLTFNFSKEEKIQACLEDSLFWWILQRLREIPNPEKTLQEAEIHHMKEVLKTSPSYTHAAERLGLSWQALKWHRLNKNLEEVNPNGTRKNGEVRQQAQNGLEERQELRSKDYNRKGELRETKGSRDVQSHGLRHALRAR